MNFLSLSIVAQEEARILSLAGRVGVFARRGSNTRKYLYTFSLYLLAPRTPMSFLHPSTLSVLQFDQENLYFYINRLNFEKYSRTLFPRLSRHIDFFFTHSSFSTFLQNRLSYAVQRFLLQFRGSSRSSLP